MTQPCLHVFKESRDENVFNLEYLTAISSECLWKKVTDDKIHPMLREPALLELARRRDGRLFNLCERMMALEDIDEWFLAVFTLCELGTHQAIQRLLLHASNCGPSRKRVVLKEIAKVLTKDLREDFIEIADMFGVPGILNITGWTKPALSALSEICRRQQVSIELFDKFVQNTSIE